jgi:hypothetical protein
MKASINNLIEKSPSLFLTSIDELNNTDITIGDLNIIRKGLLEVHISENGLATLKSNLVSEKLIETIKNNKDFSYTETIVFMTLGLSILYTIKFHEFVKAIAIPYSAYTNNRIKGKKVLDLISKLSPAELFLLSPGRTPLSASQKDILAFIQLHVSFYLSESEMEFISSLPDIVNLLNTKISKLVKVIPVETIIEIQNKVKQNAH